MEAPYFLVSSFDHLPEHRLHGFCFQDEDLIMGDKGYEKYPDAFELYDLQVDRDEKRDLVAEDTVTAARMKEELLDSLAQAERDLPRP